MTDGTTEGTRRVLDLATISATASVDTIITIGNTVFFTLLRVPDAPVLWRSDGTAEGTLSLATRLTSAIAPTELAGLLHYAVLDDANNLAIWRTDGTPGGTEQCFVLPPGARFVSPAFATLGARLLYSASDSTYGFALWATDALSGATDLLYDPSPGADQSAASMGSVQVLQGRVLAVIGEPWHGTELWVSPGP